MSKSDLETKLIRALGLLGSFVDEFDELEALADRARELLSEDLGELPIEPPGGRVPVIWNPHLLPDEPRFQFPEWADIRSWHLAEGEMPDGIGEAETQRRIDETKEKLRRIGPGTQLSFDGLRGAWPDRLEQYVDAFLNRPDQGGFAHTEHWDHQMNRASWSSGWSNDSLFNSKPGEFRQAARRRAMASLDSGGPSGPPVTKLKFPFADISKISLRAVSPIYGVLCHMRIDPVEVADWVRSTGANMMRIWCVSQWEGQGHDNINPWGKGAGPWTTDSLDPDWKKDFDSFAEHCASIGLALQVVIFDWAGVKNEQKRGHWPHSPYNQINGGPVGDAGKKYPVKLMSDTMARAMTADLARFVGAQAKKHGNIVVDPVNEPGRLGSDYAEEELGFAADIVAWANEGFRR